MTGLTPEYERKLTPLKRLAAATAGVSVVTPFTFRLLLTKWFTTMVEQASRKTAVHHSLSPIY